MTGVLSKFIATVSCSEDPPLSPTSSEQLMLPNAAEAQLPETPSTSQELTPKSKSRVEYATAWVDTWVQNSAKEQDDARLAEDCDVKASIAQERSLRHSCSQSDSITKRIDMDEEEAQGNEKEATSGFLVDVTSEPLESSDGTKNEQEESESSNLEFIGPESESDTSSLIASNVTASIRSVYGDCFFRCTGVVLAVC